MGRVVVAKYDANLFFLFIRQCHKLFRQLSTLTNHQKIHTGEKPFECAVSDLFALRIPFEKRGFEIELKSDK